MAARGKPWNDDGRVWGRFPIGMGMSITHSTAISASGARGSRYSVRRSSAFRDDGQRRLAMLGDGQRRDMTRR